MNDQPTHGDENAPFAGSNLPATPAIATGTPPQLRGYEQTGPQHPPFPHYSQPGYSQPGYPQPGYPQPGYVQPGYPQQGWMYPVPMPGMILGPPTPYGVHATGIAYSDKTKVTAGLLQLLLPLIGITGVGRLYAGHTAVGLVQLLGIIVAWFFSFFVIGIPFLIGFWLWGVIDGIVILASDSRDGVGNMLR